MTSYLLSAALLLYFLLPAAYGQKPAPPPINLQSISSVLSSPDQSEKQNVLVRGSVVMASDSTLVIQDQTGAVRIKPLQNTDVSIGDEVQVLGNLSDNESKTIHGTVRRLWSGSTPLPIAISPDQAAEGLYDLYLVETSGKLTTVHRLNSGDTQLTLEGEHQFFNVILDQESFHGTLWPSRDALEHALQPGSFVQVTGILQAQQTLDDKSRGSFIILLRSSDDVRILAGPPWWTPKHLVWLFAALMLLVLTAVLVHLRNLRLRFRAVMEERSRIARDLHDTMAQGFAGIALQLQATEQLLTRDPVSAKEHLEMALQMVRYSRSESHLSIQTLRALSRSSSLRTLLEQSAKQMTISTDLHIEVFVRGTEPPLPYETATQLYRIGQEAMVNAVRHASAKNIRLHLSFTSKTISLEVSDDGIGFDTAQTMDHTHFGLTGIRERADGLRGTLSIESSATGTCLKVEVPKMS